MDIKGTKGWKRIRMTPRRIAPVEKYDDWLGSRNRYVRHNPHRLNITGARIRRVVIMRRQGESWKDCSVAVGLSVFAIKAYTEFLPMDLQI